MARGGVKLSILSSYDKKGTDQAEKALQRFAKAYGAVDAETGKINLDAKTASLAEQSIAADQAAAKWSNFGNKAQEAGGKFTAGLTVPIGAAAAIAVNTAVQYENAGSRIEAALGGSAEEAQRFSEIGQTIYENGWGSSLDEVTTALLQTKQTIRDIDDNGLETVTTNALMLSQVFGADVNESIRGINALMTGFGLSAAEATDLMTAGMQRGLNYTDELGDNLSEYSVRWGEAGMSAEDYFSLLEAGASNGAYNLDKVGDFLNEFLTSLSDGRMESSIGQFSQGTQEVFESFKNGGATAQDVLNAVLGELNNMPDGYDKAKIASELWSSLGEDNAMGMITSLAGVQNSFGDIEGAANEAAEAASDNFATKAQSAMRELQGAIEPLGEPLLRIAGYAIDAAEDFSEWFSSIDEGSQNTVVALALVAAGIGPVTTGIGKLANAGSSVLKIYADITAQMAKNSAAASTVATSTTKAGNAVSGMAGKTKGLLSATNVTRGGIVALGVAVTALAASTIADGIRKEEEFIESTEGLTNAQMDAYNSASTMGEGMATLALNCDDLTDSTNNTGDAVSTVMEQIEQSSGGLARVGESIDNLSAKQAQFAQDTQASFSEAYSNNAQLDVYMATIDQLANKSGLSAQEQAQLKIAVDNLNTACGTSYTVIDAENGVLADQEGVALDTTDAIEKLVEAKKLDALSSVLNDAYAEQLKAEQTATANLADAISERDRIQRECDEMVAAGTMTEQEREISMRTANAEVNKAQEAYDSASQAASSYYGQLTLLEMAKAQGEGSNAAWLASNQQIGIVMAQNGQDVSAFAQQLDTAGISMSDLSGAMESSGITLQEMASVYDGSLTSIAQLCISKGVEIPQSLKDGILNGSSEVSGAVGIVKEAMVLELSGGDVKLAAELLGGELSQGLIDGIQNTDDLPPEAARVMSEETINKAKEQLQVHSPSKAFYDIGSNVSTGLANGISENSDGPIGAIGGLIGSILGGFVQLVTGGGTSGQNMMFTLGNSIFANSPYVNTQAGLAASGGVTAAFNSSDATSAGSNLVTTMSNGLIPDIINARAWALGVGGASAAYGSADATSAGGRLSSTMYNGLMPGMVNERARDMAATSSDAALQSADGSRAGKNLSSTFGMSITSFSGQANAQAMTNRSKSSAYQVSDAGYIGTNLSSSFSRGIDINAAVDRAAQLARNALTAIKDTLGIHSPSKEFMAVGRYSALGFAEGLDKNSSLVVASANSMALDAIDAANRQFDSPAAMMVLNSSNTEIVAILTNQHSTMVELLHEVRLLRTTLGQTIRSSVGNQGMKFSNENEAARWVQKLVNMNV